MTEIRMNEPGRSPRRRGWMHGRSPGLTAAAMLVLACGIGIATAMMSLVLRGLSRADPAAHPAAVLGVEATGGFTAWTARMIAPARFQAESLDALLVALLVLALFALAIAVINATIFLLSAATARRREIAVRAALGASPLRLARQLLAEGGIPAAAAAALGFGLGAAGILWLRATWPAALPTWLTAPDPRAALLGVGVPLALALLVMLAPAPATRGKLSGALTTGARATASRGEGVLQRFLVILAVAATTLLLTGAGLLLQASAPWSPGDGRGAAAAGLAPEDVHVLHVELLDPHGADNPLDGGASAVSGGDERALLQAALLARLRQLPGVSAASLASPGAVMGLGVRDHDVVDCGRCSVGGLVLPVFATFARHHVVGPGYFDTLGITLENGREFDLRDAAGSLPVAIVNEAYRASFEGGNPIGRQVRVGGFGGGWHTVVGVVREPELPGIGAGTRAEPALYLAALQHPPGALTLSLRLSEGADPDAVLSAVRAGIAGAEGVGAVSRATTLTDEMARFAAPLRWFSRIFAALALLSVLLAVAALSSVMAHAVRQRRPETGVRLALGATPRRLVLDVIGDGVRLTLIGAALGLLGTTGLVALLQGAFHGVRLFDAHIHGGVVALLLLVAVLAGGHPALRAAATQPHVAMRME